MKSDGELLRRYAHQRSEEAFAELVQRHVNVVFSAALRGVNGDAHLARDVAQAVFTDLARKAASLAGRTSVTGWLYTSAYFAAANVVRAERRRRAHEEKAVAMNELLNDPEPCLDWEKLRPALDGVMHKLKEADREVLLMRYFDNLPWAEIGRRLELGEDGARKRVERALEKLRGHLSKRGVTTVGALSEILSAHAVQLAPPGTAAAVTSGAVAAASAASGGLGLIKAASMAKLQTAALGSMVLASAVISVAIEQSAQGKIRQISSAVEQKSSQIETLQSQNQRLWHAMPQTNSLNDLKHLDKLRLQVAALEAKTAGWAAARREHDQLEESLKKARHDLTADPNLQSTTNSPVLRARTFYGMSLSWAMWDYADKHQQRFPTNLSDALPYLRHDEDTPTNVSPDLFEIAYQGTTRAPAYAHPRDIILLIEKEPWTNIDGKLVKAWISLNCMGNTCCPIDGDFATWESLHTAPPEPLNE